MSVKIAISDALVALRELESESVHCVVTSPPYWGLRDYSADGQLGLEATPEKHTEKMVEIFGEVRRVLRSDGVLWLNYGDSYCGNPSGNDQPDHSGNIKLGTRGIQERKPTEEYREHLERARGLSSELQASYREGQGKPGSAQMIEAFSNSVVPMAAQYETTGWKATCGCRSEETKPCVVLDPFAGAGTVGLVADRLGRDAILIELNEEYARMAKKRIFEDFPLFVDVEVVERCHE